MSTSGIVRVSKVSGSFFVASKGPFEDEELSWEARGVLGYLLAKPENWKCNVTDLIRKGPAGKDKIYGILKELEEAYYLSREQEKSSKGEYKRVVTVIYEHPPLNPNFDPTKAHRIWSTASGKAGSGQSLSTGSGKAGSGHQGATGSGKAGSGILINNNKRILNNTNAAAPPKAPETSTLIIRCFQCATVLQEDLLVSVPGSSHSGKSYCATCANIHEVLDAWSAAFPRGGGIKKRHPKPTTYRKQFITRLVDSEWKETCLKAIEVASKNKALQTEGWFQLEYLLRNSVNVCKVADGDFDWKHNKALADGVSVNGETFDKAWTKLGNYISRYGHARKPDIKDPALAFIIDAVKWSRLCSMDKYECKQLAEQEWNNYQAAGVLASVAAPRTDLTNF